MKINKKYKLLNELSQNLLLTNNPFGHIIKIKINGKYYYNWWFGSYRFFINKKILKSVRNTRIIIFDDISSQRLSSLFNLDNKNNNKLSFYDLDISKKFLIM